MEKHHLSEYLKRLKLPGMMNNLDMRMREAGENNLSHLEFFSLLVQDEIASREANVFDLRVRLAGFGIVKVFENFDFRFNEDIFPSSLVRELAGCRFAEQKKNLLIAGPPGIGNYVKLLLM